MARQVVEVTDHLAPNMVRMPLGMCIFLCNKIFSFIVLQ